MAAWVVERAGLVPITPEALRLLEAFAYVYRKEVGDVIGVLVSSLAEDWFKEHGLPADVSQPTLVDMVYRCRKGQCNVCRAE